MEIQARDYLIVVSWLPIRSRIWASLGDVQVKAMNVPSAKSIAKFIKMYIDISKKYSKFFLLYRYRRLYVCHDQDILNHLQFLRIGIRFPRVIKPTIGYF